MYDRGIDLRSAPYKNAYLFVVNNADCNYIQVVQNGNEYIVEVEEIPFVYFWGVMLATWNIIFSIKAVTRYIHNYGFPLGRKIPYPCYCGHNLHFAGKAPPGFIW